MKYINWYKYMGENTFLENKLMAENIDETWYVWKDIITNNIFYLKSDDKKSIIETASKYIVNFLDNKELDNLIKYLLSKDNENRKVEIDNNFQLELFIQLPYGKSGEDEKNSRLTDYLSIRTGLLYSICNCNENKDNIRHISYLTGIRDYLNEAAKVKIDELLKEISCDEDIYKKLDYIDLVLSGEEMSEEQQKALKKHTFDIVKGGVVKVKQYYFETNKIKEIRGSSILLDDINRRRIPQFIRDEFIRESIVYAGGGGIFLTVKSGEGEKTAKEIEKIYEKVTVTAQNVAGVLKNVSLLDISNRNYQNTVQKLQQIIDNRQMTKVDFRTFGYRGDINYKAYGNPIPYSDDDKDTNEDKLCKSCNTRQAQYKEKFTGEFLCLSCFYKTISGGREAKESFKGRVKEKANNKLEELGADNLDEISKANNNKGIGIIYGDGNNIGAIVQNIKNIIQMKYFSEATEKAVETAVYDSIIKYMKNDAFEIIAIGGDDIFIIVPAEKALIISKNIGETFDNMFKNHSENKFTITMSLGVVVSKANKPIQYLFDLSQQLLKSAKSKAKKVNKSGTLDVMVLETDAAFASTVKFIRDKLKIKEKNKEKICTLRPYSWEELGEVIDAIKSLKKYSLRTKAYNLMDATLNLGIGEGNLYYSYQKIRDEDNKNTEIMDGISNVFRDRYNTRKKLMYYEGEDNKFYSPWIDIVELWDYIGTGEENE